MAFATEGFQPDYRELFMGIIRDKLEGQIKQQGIYLVLDAQYRAKTFEWYGVAVLRRGSDVLLTIDEPIQYFPSEAALAQVMLIAG